MDTSTVLETFIGLDFPSSTWFILCGVLVLAGLWFFIEFISGALVWLVILGALFLIRPQCAPYEGTPPDARLEERTFYGSRIYQQRRNKEGWYECKPWIERALPF